MNQSKVKHDRKAIQGLVPQERNLHLLQRKAASLLSSNLPDNYHSKIKMTKTRDQCST